MSTISQELKLFLNLTMIQTITAKRFDARLQNHGISLNEFMILHHLANAQDEKLRRTDVAEKVGLTASGITRMLSPLEKLGYVRREANSRDARVSYVKLANAGKKIYLESIATAEATTEQIMTSVKTKKPDDLNKMLTELGATFE
jgi:DNA-binding MarR family transcriptional regulator